MKKGLKITASVILAMSVMAGCSGNSDGDGTIVPGKATDELFKEMQSSESIDGDKITEIFSDALTQSDEADSATIDTEVSIELTDAGVTSTSKNTTQIKYMPAEGSDETEETTKAVDESAEETTVGDGIDTDESTETVDKVAYVNISNDYDGTTNNIEGYYEDGYLYYDLEGTNVKEAMSYEDLMYIVGSYALQFQSDVVSEAYTTTEGDNAAYIVEFDPEAMADMMMNNMLSAGGAFGNGESMSINDAYLYFEVTPEGELAGFNMELDAKFVTKTTSEEAVSEETTTADTEAEETTDTEQTEDATQTVNNVSESPFMYSVTANFSDINNTEVEAYSDLDSYIDVNEYLEQQQAAATETTTSAENTDATTAASDQ